MPTTQQLIRSPRVNTIQKTKSPALKNCPQRRGVCTRVYTTTPKKTKLSYQKSSTSKINNRI